MSAGTSFESVFSDAPAGHAVICRRSPAFDYYSGLQHSPHRYSVQPAQAATDELPTEAWVWDAFMQFVRGEFGQARIPRPAPPRPLIVPGPPADEDRVMLEYLDSCEENLVYHGVAAAIAREAGDSVRQGLYAMITHPVLGNPANVRNVDYDALSGSIEALLEHKQRLQFVMPSFPFKDQNMFRCIGPASHVDLGEAALLARLHTLSMAMYQVHPYGVDWVILSDGLAYSEILRVEESDCRAYFENLRACRDVLDIGGSVHILDLRSLTQKIVSESGNPNIFDQTAAHISRALRSGLEARSDIQGAFAILRHGMKRNMSWKDVSSDFEWEVWWDVLQALDPADVDLSARDVALEVHNLATTAAFDYAAFNLALRFHNAISRILPSTVRATVHPKPGQVAVPKLGSEYPWNGMALIRGDSVSVDSVEVAPLYSLGSEGTTVVRHNSGDGAPFFCYTHETKKTS